MHVIDKVKNHIFIDYLAIGVTVLFVLAGIIVSVNRFWQYDIFYYNFGVFDEAIWHVSRFQPPAIEHVLVGGRLLFADHFDISILLLAPIFWITQRSEALLVVQALFAGLAGFVMYRIGIEVLKDKLLAFSIACCYFLFVGIQNAVITDFQEITIMTLPITLTFLAIIKKRIRLFWLFFLITLGFKEVTFALGIGIAIFVFMYNKQWRKHAVIATIISILWGYLAIKVFIPYFSQGLYLHWPDFADTLQGKVFALADNPIKRRTLFFSLLQFGFLPIFAPSMWAAILQDYVLRFLPKYDSTYWGLGLHYNAAVSTLLGIASVFGFSYLLRFRIITKLQYVLALVLVFNAIILFRVILHGPFLLAINPVFYQDTTHFTFLNKIVAKIPHDASIMIQNNLGVRFDHQHFIYLRYDYKQYAPDYILLDMRPGQNPNDFFLTTLQPPLFPPILEKIKLDTNYKLIYHTDYQYIFKKKT